MSDDGEGPLTRWSRRKRRVRAGRPVADAPGRDGSAPSTPGRPGGAAPVAGRRLVPSLPPLAGAEDDPDDPYRSAPIVEAHGLPPALLAETPDDGDRALTPEEEEAVKKLPPIESLDKESDYTPFLADNIPDFIRRKALRVLWRSDPVLANLDGLNDYDEDFSMAALVAEALQAGREARRMAKARSGENRDEGQDGSEDHGPRDGDEAAAEKAAGTEGPAGDAPEAADAAVGGADGDMAADAGGRPGEKATDADAGPGGGNSRAPRKH